MTKITDILIPVVTFTFVFFLPTPLFSQSSHKLLRDGDFWYDHGLFDQAEEMYRKANEKDKSLNGTYNLGNSLYQQERYEEAVQQYQDAAGNAQSDEQKSMAYHNLGNAYFNNQKYKESLDAYKSALKFNPEDPETKENLMAARMMMKKMQQQQKKEQNEQQQKKEDQKKEEDNEQQESSPSEQEPEGSSNVGEKQGLDKEDAKKLLEIVDNEEQKVQEKLRQVNGGDRKTKKDW